MIIELKMKAIAKMLNVSVDLLERTFDTYYEHKEEVGEYRVFTKKERESEVKEQIKNDLWTFTPEFLHEKTEFDIVIFQAFLDSQLCESANDAIMALIESSCGIDDFIQTAIDQQGYAYYLSYYDNEFEETVSIEDNTFYIYRTN